MTVDRPLRRRDPHVILTGAVLADLAALAVVHVHAWTTGWRLVGDPAIVVLRASDTFSRRTSLVGMPSGFSAWSTAADPFHPGPAALWALAPTGWFGTGEGTVLALTWIVGALCTLTVAAAARRVAGPWVAVAAVLATMIFQFSIASTPIWTPLTLGIALQPLFALCFATWAVIAGHHRFLLPWVVLASFVAQADLTYATTVAALGIAVVVALARATFVRDRPRPTLRDLGPAIAATVVLWALPAIEAVVDGGGNVAELLRAAGAGEPVVGPGRSLAELTSIITRSFLSGAGGMDRVRWAVLVAAVAAVAGCRALHRAARRDVPLVVVAAVATFGAVAGQGLTPVDAVRSTAPYQQPVTAASGFAWFAFTVVAWRALEARTGRDPVLIRARFAGALLAWSTFLVVISGLPATDPYLQDRAAAIDPLVAAADARLDDGTYTWHPLGGPDATALGHGVTLRLLDHGIVPHADGGLEKYYGSGRRVDGAEQGDLYLTLGATEPPVAGAELVARWVPRDWDERTARTTRRRLADEVRAAPIRFRDPAPYAVGTIVAALDPPSRTRWSGRGGDDALVRLGAGLLAHPEAVRTLSDAAIAELVAQDALEAPPLPTDLAKAVDRSTSTSTVELWYRPSGPGRRSGTVPREDR